MNEKQHMLIKLRDEVNRWETLLADLREAQITAPQVPSEWSIKDEIVHLWAWQRRSIARLDAALHDHEPQYLPWPGEPVAGADTEDDTDRINARIYAAWRERPWADVHRDWRTGFLHFIELGEALPEPDLLAQGQYPWLGDYTLLFIMHSSYAHHDEHFGHVLAWLWQSGNMRLVAA